MATCRMLSVERIELPNEPTACRLCWWNTDGKLVDIREFTAKIPRGLKQALVDSFVDAIEAALKQ